MADLQEVFRFIDEHADQALGDLARLCRQPSVSAQEMGVEECAALTVALLKEAGIQAEALPGAGGPPVVSGFAPGGPRTLLLYHHYDVQPAEPIDEWTSSPFEPVVSGGNIYARGASDDKGNLVARIWAVRAYREVFGRLPVSVKFLVEGEEEVGSPHLEAFLSAPEQRSRFAADYCLWEGSTVDWEGIPDIRLGVKGILYVEMEVRTAARDLHSSWAAVAPNPAWRLIWALSTLKDRDERVLIPGFYDRVRPDLPQEEASLRGMPDEAEQSREAFGAPRLLDRASGAGYWRRLLMEPTCNICGIESGYTGPGTKTVLPAVARAKIDFRLVPDQRPADVLQRLREHLDARGFGDVSISSDAGEAPARTRMDHPFARLVAEAALPVYGSPGRLRPSAAGTGPMAAVVEALGVPVADAGVGYPDSRIHAPNEHIRIEDFVRGTKHVAAVLHALGQAG